MVWDGLNELYSAKMIFAPTQQKKMNPREFFVMNPRKKAGKSYPNKKSPSGDFL